MSSDQIFLPITKASELARDFVDSGTPETYFFTAIGGFFLAKLLSADAYGTWGRIQNTLTPIYYFSLMLQWASVIGFVWGSVPLSAAAPIAVAIWVESQINARRSDDRAIERNRKQLPTGAEILPFYR